MSGLSGGIDEVFQRTDSAGARSFLTDALGSTLALTDSTGTAQTSYTFEPIGNTSVTGAATTNSFVYTGRELDLGNLYFYRARYYNPSLQRFISEDPLGFSGGDTNLYGYVFESPANLVDPFGLSAGPGAPGGGSGMAGRSCGPCSKPPAGPTPVPWADVDQNIHDAIETAADEDLSYSLPWFLFMVEKGGAWDYNSYYP